MKRLNKKGQAGTVITLITGVGVAVLVLILVGSMSGTVYETVDTDVESIGLRTLVDDDSFTAINGTPGALDHASLVTDYTVSVINATHTLGMGNFTIYYTGGYITLNTTSAAFIHANNGTTLYATYRYNDPTVRAHIRNGVISGFDALDQTGNYMPIIVMAVIIVLILGMIFGLGMTGGAYRGGGGAL